ncbi:hypothetical protein A3B18_02930 [Candidatus Giovannonibacteria bacterium RIFCSPLOWO2_01_FULL_46_13]|uniref:DUF4393 domain-containing protein n=1 Tax=Candidatus Giovannonibacteria bacterium RIFCSPLOWO2_01_FULL_46_13 TaxID=1798352 RepID=A0A1F5X3W1_9BACT|nr:MAG: hypothetical protein A3B18_02930 [Candidatus Giovannonibacteria bacterium RIFCSPLOWO2_01_FULL_46_13]
MTKKNKPEKIEIGSIKKTASEIIPFAVNLISPETFSDPSAVVTKVSQGIATYFLSKFLSEYREKLEKKEIKDENFETEKPTLALRDLFKAIEGGDIDDEKFKAMKSVFFSGISKHSKQKDEVQSYEFLQTAKKLSGMEILILRANFEIASGKSALNVSVNAGIRSRNAWRNEINKQIGFEDMEGAVFKYEKNLESLGLISPRVEMDRLQGDFEPTPNFRLTRTGYKFCEFMIRYE